MDLGVFFLSFFGFFFRVIFLIVFESFWGAILGRFGSQNRLKMRLMLGVCVCVRVRVFWSFFQFFFRFVFCIDFGVILELCWEAFGGFWRSKSVILGIDFFMFF